MPSIGRESISSSTNGRKEVKKVVGYTDKPDLTDTGKKLVRLFNWCQSEDVSISKAVKELRKLFDVITESKERRNFFSNLVFMLQVKLFGLISNEAKWGPDSRFIVKANIKAL